MAVESAVHLTQIPPFPALSDRAAGTYNTKAFNFGTHMGGTDGETPGTFNTEINALADNVQHNAQEAADAAGGASASLTDAQDARDAAQSARDDAQDARDAAALSASGAASAKIAAEAARDDAQDARDAAVPAASAAEDARDLAEQYRDQAETFAAMQLTASSSTSVTPGAGSKSFAIETGRAFVAGMYLVATSTGEPDTRMSGAVVSYDSSTGALVLDVDAYAGAGARADWVIGVAAAASLAIDQVTGLADALDGLLDVPTGTVTSAAYTLQLADRGTCVDVGHDITVPKLDTVSFAKGAIVNLQNISGTSRTITAESGATVYLAGDASKTGPFTLKGYGWAVLRKIDAASTWVISGAGL